MVAFATILFMYYSKEQLKIIDLDLRTLTPIVLAPIALTGILATLGNAIRNAGQARGEAGVVAEGEALLVKAKDLAGSAMLLTVGALWMVLTPPVEFSSHDVRETFEKYGSITITMKIIGWAELMVGGFGCITHVTISWMILWRHINFSMEDPKADS